MRCATCPRAKPGECWAESRGRVFCERYAAGDRTHERLLTGDVEPVILKPGDPGPVQAAPLPIICPWRDCSTGCARATCLHTPPLGDLEGGRTATLGHCRACVKMAAQRNTPGRTGL